VDPSGWNGELSASAVDVPGDLSSAAFLLVAAAVVPGSDVTVEHVGLNPTRTGVLDALRAMGANIEVVQTSEAMGEPVGRVRVRWAGPLRATRDRWRSGLALDRRDPAWPWPARSPRGVPSSPTWASCA
jgi:5-enolpyruvylshikimate-3-phosphate synthase